MVNLSSLDGIVLHPREGPYFEIEKEALDKFPSIGMKIQVPGGYYKIVSAAFFENSLHLLADFEPDQDKSAT